MPSKSTIISNADVKHLHLFYLTMLTILSMVIIGYALATQFGELQ